MTKHLLSYLSYFIFACLLGSCTTIPKGHFGSVLLQEPDYSLNKYWAALPEVVDSADAVAIPEWKNVQATSPVDVFFIHPTSYIGKSGQNKWNADINDVKVNDDVDQAPIRYQATIFNGAGKVYAPRYRQAHLHAFFTKRKEDAKAALALAYKDVTKAFKYYLDHFNHGRPFIIAGHSQGSLHGSTLIKDFVDGTPLQKQLVVAYLPGWAIPKDFFQTIKPCTSPEETGCFNSWRTVKEGYLPRLLHMPGKNILVTNPVSWTLDPTPTRKEDQLGGILRDFNTMRTKLVSIRIYEDLLWSTKPDFPGAILLTKKNYHIADYNLFYADVRKNAQDRVRAYLEKH
ncbi:MAG TPA: DUF3089 domain-containing protein [Saprospiraceae bacterium]|nr:DUF3089 domain-containing protein [Saprospiraceae bacterium]